MITEKVLNKVLKGAFTEEEMQLFGKTVGEFLKNYGLSPSSVNELNEILSHCDIKPVEA